MPEKLKYATLWLFVAGVFVIVFLQFLSGENINRLVKGNQQLLHEIHLQNDLRKLEADVLTVESDLRGLVITGDPTLRAAAQSKINNIAQESNVLEQVLRNETTPKQLKDLNFLIAEKIRFGNLILNTYQTKGKAAGEGVINSGRGKEVRDSIVLLIRSFDNLRHARLQQIANATETNAMKARTWGTILAIVAGATCLLMFLYLLRTGRNQQRMIQKLNESEKQIRDSAAVKEQFLANMSHEIRTPMNAILGFTNLLKKTSLDGQQLQYVDFIHSSGENLLTLINDILDLSKIEAGMLQLERQPFSLNGLISSVEIMFQDKARSKGLQFSVSVDPTIPDTLSGDAIRLTQILINLLSNAIKFTERGSVRLDVTAAKNTGAEVQLLFTVKDTGIGIASQLQQSIFERFQQADAETTRRFGGTGLGLSIVKQLVDMQGGTISVASQPGMGTAFAVCLPFTPIADMHVTRVAVNPDMERRLRGVRVLIAEDNAMNQHLIRHLMKYWHIDYTLVNNGREAIEAVQQQAFSLVLMDIQMPEIDGYAATQTIRTELKSEVPIIAMTAHAMAGEKEKCLSYGMNDYISKPIKEMDLYTMLEQYAGAVSAPKPTTEMVINLQYLRELSMGDSDFEQAIIRQFIVQVPEELDLLQEAITARQYVKIKSIAHGMKSSVAYMGLTEKLNSYLQRMESESVLQPQTPHFDEDFEQVKTICGQALAEAKLLPTLVS